MERQPPEPPVSPPDVAVPHPRSNPPARPAPSVDADAESCDWCGSTDLWWRNCKLLCRSCSAIVKSCADL
jgi:hypothetical protein